ncbi:MAG: Asp23/Gls24 family envelope stress response protein [Haloechinothrix sp.]
MTTDRGWLQIDHSVVRKIAQHAADQVHGVATDRRGSNAKVHGTGDEVDLLLDLPLYYPAPVRSVVADVREKVTAEIEHLTSYRVRAFEVTVSELLPDIPPRVR